MNPPGPVLKDIHPPPPPSWWPPAYGWWLLAAVWLLVVAVLMAWGLRRYRQRRRWRRIARQIDRERERFVDTGDMERFAGALSQWLRRAARERDGRAVHLQGEEWRAFLREHAPRGVDTGSLESLEAAVYRPGVELDREAVVAAVRAWVRHALARA